MLGQDTAAVLTELLQLTSQDLDALRQTGVTI
jgi:crotonobetainyl-CoA:carnitine CoA-transferase CaiB-like acyl-CoA transferase